MAIDTTKKVKKITVDGKSMVLVADEDKEIVIKLPEEAWGASNVSYFKINNDKYLFNAVRTTAFGIYEYTVSTETSVRLYNEGSEWNVFKEVPNGILIMSNSATTSGILFYDYSAKTVTKIYSGGNGYNSFVMLNDAEMLIQGANAMNKPIYNLVDNSITSPTGLPSVRYYTVKKYDNGAIMAYAHSSSASTNSGICKYNAADHSFTRVYTQGYSFTTYEYENEILYYNPRSSYGLLHYDINTKQMTVVSEGVDLAIDSNSKITKIGNNFIIPPRKVNQPIRLLDGETLTLSNVYDAFNSGATTASTVYVSVINEDVLLISTNNSGYGVVSYDNSSRAASQVYDSDNSFQFKHIIGDKAIGVAYSTSIRKVLSYDIPSNTISLIYTADGNFGSTSIQANDNIIFPSASSSNFVGLLVYRGSNEAMVKPFTSGLQWSYVSQIENVCLIASGATSTSTQGILVFDLDTFTVSRPYTQGLYWTFNLEPDGNFVGTTTQSSYSRYRLFYDKENKTITLKEWVAK